MQKEGLEEREPDEGEEVLSNDGAVALTVNLVRAYVANHTVPPAQLGALLEQTHRTVLGLTNFRAEPVATTSAATSIRPDSLVCLECGREFRSLKRHIAAHHALTPEQYRAQWNLPSDYPMVAPEYAKSRSRLALANGFGVGRKKPHGPKGKS